MGASGSAIGAGRRGVFGDTPGELRALVLLLYALVGPAFTGVLWLQRDPSRLPWAPWAVAALIGAGAIVLWLRPSPGPRAWLLPVAIVPAVCCGIASVACGPGGLVYVAITSAQVTWGAVLCDAEVGLVAWLVAVASAGATFASSAAPATAAFETTLFALVSGLVGWTAFGKAQRLRAAVAERAVRAERDRALLEAMPDTLARATADGVFLDVHAPAGDALPRHRDELVGVSVFAVVDDHVDAKMRAAIDRALATGEVATVEYDAPYEGGTRSFESRFVRSGPREVTVVRRDVTDRVAADRDRRLLAALVEQTRDAVIVLDAEFRVLVWSGASTTLSGVTSDEAIGRPVREVGRTEVEGETLDEVRARLAKHGATRFRGTCRRKDGAVVAMTIDVAQLHTGPDEAARWLCVARDVTREHAAEAALQESEERYRSIVTAMSEGVVVQAADGNVIAANPAAGRILGPALGALTGAGDAEGSLVDEASRPLAPSASPPRRVLATGEAVRDESVGVARATGEVVWLDVTSMPLHGARDHGAVLTTFSDTTEHRRLLEAERHEHERKLREARLVGLEERVNEIELVTSTSGRILEANDRALAAYGYTRDEIRALNIADLRPPSAREIVASRLATIAASGALRFETEHLHRDGTPFPALVSSRTFEVEGEVFVHNLVHDLTEDRRLAEQLQQAERMESVGRLAGGIAHDFNNLLTVIRSTCDLALEDVDQASPTHEDLEQIGEAAARASELTRQLLAVSRKQKLDPRRVDLGDVVRHLAPMLRKALGELYTLDVVAPPTLPPCLLDPSQIDQVLLNLAINARDAMPRGGTIRVDVRAVRDPDEPGAFGPAPPAGEFVRIAVADEGTGIDAATLERIFEPFFTTKAKGKGTGLGLAMVYGIVSQSQGHIAVSSTVGIGTELRLYFPVCASAATADAAPRSEGPRTSARRATVLVVDDERLVGEVARRILEHAGHAVVIAGGGAEALALAATRRFDLVLCDVVMPEVSGPEVAARLAASADGPPVLFMSGHADADLGAESKLVVTDYLRKPFSSAALPAKVDALLELAGRPRERGKGAELAVTA